MEGWMKYKIKGGITGRISGFLEHSLWFTLSSDCSLRGFSDKNRLEKCDVSFPFNQSVLTIDQESQHQFELVGSKQHVVFTVEDIKTLTSWVTAIQKCRDIANGDLPSTLKHHPIVTKRRNQSGDSSGVNSRKQSATERSKSQSAPSYRDSSSSVCDDYEWDSDIIPDTPHDTASIDENSAIFNMFEPGLDESSALFQLSKELSEAKAELNICHQRIISYQEVLASRDKQLFDMQENGVLENDKKGLKPGAEEHANLQEQVRSYKEQNSILNEEILKINKHCSKMKNLAMEQKRRADKLDSELRKFQRDFISVLGNCVCRPLIDPDDGARLSVPEQSKHISTLKQLAKQMKVTNDKILGCSTPSIGKSEHVGMFGFTTQLPNEPIQIQYLCCHLIEAMDTLSDNRDEKMLKNWKSCIRDNYDQFDNTPNLQKLIRHGIPGQFRAYVWQKLIHYYVSDFKQNMGEAYYPDLIKQQDAFKRKVSFVKHLKQIVMDVPRTMPSNRDFMKSDSQLQERLTRVLTSFCIHAEEVGYCQGFNFIAGGCLLFLEEEDAFWFLVTVTEVMFPPTYYLNGLSGLLADQYVLKWIVSITLPRLHEHLLKYPDVDLAVITSGWFLGLFFDSFPFKTLIRLWDCFLAFGHEALFRISIAIFQLFEHEILGLNEASMILHAVKNMPKLCFHPQQIIDIAFTLHNFPSWEEIEIQQSSIEIELIRKHEEKMQQSREFEQRMGQFGLFDGNEAASKSNQDRWIFEHATSNSNKVLVSANNPLLQRSKILEVLPTTDILKDHLLQIKGRIMCMYIVNDEFIVVGLLTGQMQCYSLDDRNVYWSMSMSDVVLCIAIDKENLYIGTADGKIHFLELHESINLRKPKLLDSVELSKQPTSCICLVDNNNYIWTSSGPAVYIISTQTYETDGFFLISAHLEHVSFMIEWPQVGIFIATRGSSVLQLRDGGNYKSPPLTVFDVANGETYSPLYPMMKDETLNTTSQVNAVAALLFLKHDSLWVGTKNGMLKQYSLHHDNSDGEDSSTKIELKNEKDISEKPVRCLLSIKKGSEDFVVSCCGSYFDQIKLWSPDLHETSLILEGQEESLPSSSSLNPSSTRMSDLMSRISDDGSVSLESSSTSLESEQQQRQEGDESVWKSAMKSAAATALKTYRDKKPGIRKFMNW